MLLGSVQYNLLCDYVPNDIMLSPFKWLLCLSISIGLYLILQLQEFIVFTCNWFGNMDKMMLSLHALVSFGCNRSCWDLTKQLMNENLIRKFVYTAHALAASHQSELSTIELRWIFVLLYRYAWIIYVTNPPVALNVHGLPNSTFVDVQWWTSESERLDHSDHVLKDNYRSREYDESQIISWWWVGNSPLLRFSNQVNKR